MRHTGVFRAWVLLAGVVGAQASREAEVGAATRPNLVFVMADDLGYGEVGCYGQSKIATPRLDRMAAEGTRFTQWYAPAPVCAPSRACLISGLHGGHAAVRDNKEVQPEGQHPLPAGAPGLARMMQGAGYDTAMIGKWGLGAPGSSGEPGRQGFDAFFGYLCQREAHHFYPDHLWRLTPEAASRDAVKVVLEGNRKTAGPQHAQDLFREEIRVFVAEGPAVLSLPADDAAPSGAPAARGGSRPVPR